VCPISRRSYRYGILYPHNIHNIVYRTYMLTYFRLIIIMMWVGVGIWVHFQIGCCPAAAAVQVRPKFVFFPNTFTVSKGPTRRRVSAEASRYLRKKILKYYGFFHTFQREGVGHFYRFTPTTDFSILSTPTLHSTRANRCHYLYRYYTYF